jgi:deazaflavin-dependent oxidoreductase (nitroreductase family)
MSSEQREESTDVPRGLNTVMKLVLRTPLLHKVVSANIMLITFKGRKSGKSYTTPVSYIQEGDIVTLFTGRRRAWWRNLSGGETVTLRIQGKNVTRKAESVEDVEQIAEGITRLLKHSHMDAKYYNVTYNDDGNPNAEQVKSAAETTVMMQVTLG